MVTYRIPDEPNHWELAVVTYTQSPLQLSPETRGPDVLKTTLGPR